MHLNTLGKRVKEARLSKKMTQKELAGDCITRNMLSQIENESATPSLKTIEHIAAVLQKPVSYFIEHDQGHIESGLIEELMVQYESKAYVDCMDKIEGYFDMYPRALNSNLLKNIYMNSCLKAATLYKETGDFEASKVTYEKILKYESDLIFESDVVLYNVYSHLAEISGHMKVVEEAKRYDEKAKNIVSKMMASRVIQGIYISFIEGNYDDVIKRISALDINELDDYNKGRYYMMIGSAYYYKEDYKTAIQFLEAAIVYYKDKTYNSVLEIIYDELSKSYSHTESYGEAYKYLQLSLKK